jgi:hypothetical protein
MPANGNPSTVFLGQLLSSGFDADKLDYMTRESHFSKIPLGIDEVRLIDKIRVFSCEPTNLPKDLSYLKELLPLHTQCKVLGFSAGGQFAFEESAWPASRCTIKSICIKRFEPQRDNFCRAFDL